MDTGTLLVGILMFAIVLIPFIYAIRHQKRKHNKEKQEAIELAKSQHLNLDYIEVINDLIIGIDSSKGTLFSSQKTAIKEALAMYSLKDYQSCVLHSIPTKWVGIELKDSKNTIKLTLWETPGEEFPDKDFMACKDMGEKWVKKIHPFLMS